MSILVKYGRVVDPATGTDDALDVLIQGDRIAARGTDLAPPEGGRVVDATGMVVMPGFIDMHTHSDFTVGTYPEAPARLHQGVTTDVTGNCGFSPFPLPPGPIRYGSFFAYGDVPAHARLADFARYLRDRSPAINIAPLVGLGSVRTYVMGDAPSAPSRQERLLMRTLVARALEDGAFGVSSGLVYSPGRHAGPDEIVDLLRPLGDSRRLYATHLRDERDGLVDAVAEAISTAERVSLDLHISHHKALGSANWGRTEQTLAMIDEANARGRATVTLDYYPFVAGSTGLSSLLPPGVLEDGWPALRAGLADVAFRGRVLTHIRGSAQFRPDEVVIGQSATSTQASGRRVVELAEQRGQSPEEIILSLLEAEGEWVTMIVPAASRQDLDAVSRHRQAMHGSDAWLMTSDQARHEHPRNLTSTIRMLEAAFDGRRKLIEIVDQLSAFPARRLKLSDRGTLAVGAFADVVIADPDRAGRLAEHESTYTYPDLVRRVFVNGQEALADGALTGARPGRVLHSP